MHRNNDYFDSPYPRPRKVKHVKFFIDGSLDNLEIGINSFVDANPQFKILGVRLFQNDSWEYVATVTYLEDASGVEYEDYNDSFED